MTHTHLGRYLTLLVMPLMLAACGKDFVKDAKLSEHMDKGQVFVSLETQVNIGNFNLGLGNIPIPNPRKPGTSIGTVTLKAGMNGGASVLAIDVNASELLALPPLQSNATLPNGEQIPMAGLDMNRLVTFTLNGGHRFYVLINPDTKDFVVGTALVIPSLTPPSFVPSGSMFIPFHVNNLSGLAGIFLGQQKSETGFALFIDASSVFKGNTLMASTFPASASAQPSQWYFAPKKASWLTQNAILNMLNDAANAQQTQGPVNTNQN